MVKNRSIDPETDLELQHLLKAKAYKTGLKRLRSRLSPAKRGFSYFAQSRIIDDLSNFLGRTLARPIPLLSGSVVALLGTLVTVYLAKHYGYSYNYFLIVYFFIAGYLLELLVEILIILIIKFQ